jgi:hypothetical protein
MYPDTPSVSQLSNVISQAAAPAFMLGALAAFIAILISRLNRIIDRTIVDRPERDLRRRHRQISAQS